MTGLTLEQINALCLLAERFNSPAYRTQNEKFDTKYWRSTYHNCSENIFISKIICHICKRDVVLDGNDEYQRRVITEHGLAHLKQYNLLCFI